MTNVLPRATAAAARPTTAGVPCVFWDHVCGPSEAAVKNCILALIGVRARSGITSESAVTILRKDSDLYLANIDDK